MKTHSSLPIRLSRQMRNLLDWLASAALASVLAATASAQNPLTNQDVVTLAGAGFSEGFILDAIAGSRNQFDTSAPALAELAKHAVRERIIRAMMDQNAGGSSTGAAFPEGVPVVMPSPSAVRASRPKKGLAKTPSTAALALESSTPYYEWKSVLFGLWKKQVGIAPQTKTPAAQRLGRLYQQGRPPQGQIVRSYPYEQMTYYVVAPR
jgi:phage tail protein X